MIEENNLEYKQDEFLNSKNIEKEFNNRLLDSALHYARIGYPVFPLHNVVREVIEKIEIMRCSCSEWRGCKCQGKHPRTPNGFKDATTNEDRIIDWWEKYPTANIGLPTGKETGIFVLDVDWKHGGEQSLEDLQDYYRAAIKSADGFQPLPATLTSNTGSGGRHLYFKYPLGCEIRNSESKIDNGLDVRANGGYIIASPSENISGRYFWHGVNTPIEAAPDWLLYEILKSDEEPKRNAKASYLPKVKNGEKIKDGQRNIYLAGQAWGLVRSYTKEEVLRRCLVKNEADLVEPLEEDEVEKIVEKACKNYNKKSKNMALRK